MTAQSQNGWSATRPDLIVQRPVPGTDVKLRVRSGRCGDLLILAAELFDLTVERISNGRGGLDDWGYAERPIRGSSTTLSNHASGTAVDLNATRHPLAKVGTYTPAARAALQRLQDLAGGALRCGEFYRLRKDGMHLEVNTTDRARIDAAIVALTAELARVKGTAKPASKPTTPSKPAPARVPAPQPVPAPAPAHSTLVEALVALSDADLDRVAQAIARAVWEHPVTIDAATQQAYGYAHPAYTAGALLRGADARGRKAGSLVTALAKALGKQV